MKALLIAAAMIGAFGGQLAAQASSPGNVVVPSAGGAVVVPWIWNLSWWGDPSCGRPHGDNGFPSWGYACDPLYAGNYGYSYPVASLTIALPQVEAPQPPAPPRARLVVNEYHWPPSGDKPSAAKDADLVVLTANPLDSLRNTERIELVVKAGKIFKAER